MELNAEKIKKALECCASSTYKCEECPIEQDIKDNCECGRFLAKNALALINEQEQKIKELEKCVEYLSSANDYIVVLKNKIEELTEQNERLNRICESYALQYGTAIDKE